MAPLQYAVMMEQGGMKKNSTRATLDRNFLVINRQQIPRIPSGIFDNNQKVLVCRLVVLGGISHDIGGRRPRGPHLGQMARVLYPYIP